MTRKVGRGALLTSNLPQLQNLIKRDPIAYKDEFLQQWGHYDSIRRIFALKPDDNAQAERFRELVTFISHVAQCFPKETAEFPSHLSELLLQNYSTLTPDTRKTLVSNLVMLRNKDVISSVELLKSLFPLLPKTTSSSLRSFIRKTILTDIRTANQKTKNHKLNRAVQTMLFGMVERGMDGEVQGDKGKLRNKPVGERETGEEAMWAIMVAKELWRKGVWNDAKTVSIVELGCFHPVTKVQSASLHFFLGSDEEAQDSDEDDDEGPDMRALQHKRTVNKKTRSGEKKIAKSAKQAKKKQRAKASDESKANFTALQLLNDPQTFGEKLYDLLNKYDKRFSLDHKILMMQLLSRVMGAHKLCVLSFYSFIVKYLTYHQLRVTSILVALAQSTHDLTPPDVLEPVVRKIAHEFVHPGVGPEVIAAGLNSIREVARRQPWCVPQDLLGDLIEYRKSRDKAVTSAARSLLQLYREVNPGMLKRRERGKSASMGMKAGSGPLPFGHAPDAARGIEGLELLEDHLENKTAGNSDAGSEAGSGDDNGWDGWDVESDSDASSSASEGWIDVESDSEELEISDSDDEDDKKKKKKGKQKESDEESDEELGPDSEQKPEEARVSTLATTKILTPADFALLNELRIQAATKEAESGGGTAAKRKLAALEAQKKVNSQNPGDVFLSEGDIEGPRKKAKADYEERMALIQKGREGREKFGSSRGKKRKDVPSSSTNREKARNKPLMMILASGAVRNKKKASLRDKQKKLRAHIDRAKKAK
ncbi:Protein sda1 OS=Schizosaccharomyces pombe (strain 972 / ATCC 24843) GN=sda1 PE=3 SV=2 [Rhizoctonia solani AG-1 IB]|uniref:Protein SDA1 n=1 Tax=Thanatephorus cucumeris (strain AG1-IB / isolate 7/3/14) TaxID=1108050 RepID=A0A0B7FQP0_THACB|nr:Protein sda1 OS=Schizosaccharomyces pombe (strain 972 / ATCC 24843) GN=sda1 PE=3 SV=2 [Rhizoctonia solani AG-1 IB]